MDKTKHKVKVSDLPCCHAILSNIPKESGNIGEPIFCCKRHSKKKIKFMCELHKEFLCTNCVLEHTGNGHQVVSFKPDCK